MNLENMWKNLFYYTVQPNIYKNLIIYMNFQVQK